MIFGEKFYPSLGRLSPWRQSLFALTLAQRQLANLAFFADMKNLQNLTGVYQDALKILWIFHQDKFNHIDLEAELTKLAALVFDPEDFKGSDGGIESGAKIAFNALNSARAAFDAVIMKEGREAEIASKSSLSSVIIACQMLEDEFLDDDTLRDHPLVDNEVNCQVRVYEYLLGAKREQDPAKFLLKIALKDDVSNVGISLGDTSFTLDPQSLILKADGGGSLSRAQSCDGKKPQVNKGLKGRERRRKLDAKRTGSALWKNF